MTVSSVPAAFLSLPAVLQTCLTIRLTPHQITRLPGLLNLAQKRLWCVKSASQRTPAGNPCTPLLLPPLPLHPWTHSPPLLRSHLATTDSSSCTCHPHDHTLAPPLSIPGGTKIGSSTTALPLLPPTCLCVWEGGGAREGVRRWGLGGEGQQSPELGVTSLDTHSSLAPLS